MNIELSQLEDCLHEAYLACSSIEEGKNASYIPALAGVDPKLFGLAAVTVTGEVFTAGDSEEIFAIESIAKAFNLSLAMDIHGAKVIRTKVGSASTGEAFNSILSLELHGGRPMNPLVNAGAISTMSLISGSSSDAIWKRVMGRINNLCGHELTVLKDVYTSESDANDHNRAMAYLLKSYGYLYNEVELSLDLYTRMCSIGVSARDLAVMGACLASGGIHPLSTQRVLYMENIPNLLADMSMEGLYTGSGKWFYQNGVPAKSGVGGGLFCVVPGKMAIAAFSPRLDADGNSLRGMAAISYVIEHLKLNLFRC